MKTIKLPYTTDITGSETIRNIQRKYSPIVRSAYKRFRDGMKEKEVRAYIKSIFPSKDSWFVQSAIYEAKGMSEVDRNQKRARIFGGKNNLIKRSLGKISNDQWKELRLLPISSVGEAPQKGNRKFSFDTENNKIIFKISKNNHVVLNLPHLRKNYSKELKQIELLCLNKSAPISIKLSGSYIFISYDECYLKDIYKPISNRYAGIDMNPNYIGLVICDNDQIIEQKIYNLNELTAISGKASNDLLSKYKTNKLHHETLEITKDITELCRHYQVNLLSLEALTIKAKDHSKGKSFNRLINNKWNRNLFVNSIKKRCNLIGIRCVEINPAYSSVIGNIVHRLPDPISAAMEIARRGDALLIKKNRRFYPQQIPSSDQLANLWKKEPIGNLVFATWKELFDFIKNSKLKYRVPIDSVGFKKFRSYRSSVIYR